METHRESAQKAIVHYLGGLDSDSDDLFASENDEQIATGSKIDINEPARPTRLENTETESILPEIIVGGIESDDEDDLIDYLSSEFE